MLFNFACLRHLIGLIKIYVANRYAKEVQADLPSREKMELASNPEANPPGPGQREARHPNEEEVGKLDGWHLDEINNS